MLSRRAVVLAVSLLAPSLAGAATLRVPQDFPTIQAAVDAAADGDVVRVSKGTYAPFAVHTPITVKGKGKPVVDGGGTPDPLVTITSAIGAMVDGFVLRNGTGRGVEIGDGAEEAIVRRCTIDGVAEGVGIVSGTKHLVEKNRIEGVTLNGITLDGTTSLATIAKNRVKDAGDEGIQLSGSAHLLEQNRVEHPVDDGIDVEGSDNVLRRNSVKDAGDSGIEVGETDDPGTTTRNLFEKNKVTGSVAHGFYVADTGNTFRRNKASKNGGFDLVDETGTGGNVYDKNKFPTQEFP